MNVRDSICVGIFWTLLQLSYGQSMAPLPAPEGPSNDDQSTDPALFCLISLLNAGKAIDQGIAYVLLFVALAITHLFRLISFVR
ncbi:hypothetical protein ACJRO7_014160 [Eucalyptus globulus]|uniref:Uncharacterized protein n=1 Tax=Eucalyptus globulus TaxID=34317 RepID=A0ABD3KZ84_EUCGL